MSHDIGHPLFGHLGEKILSDLCEKHGIGRFEHNVEGVKFLDDIEDCDLTLQVLDGILCHNGEKLERCLKPDRNIEWENFDHKIKKNLEPKTKYVPMTLEGCVVRMTDIIAFLEEIFRMLSKSDR